MNEIDHLMSALNASDTKIYAAIAQAEEALHKRVSIRLEMPLPDERTLVFGKHDKSWCFQIVSNGTVNALRSCSRNDRAAFFSDGWLDKFLATITAQLGDYLIQREHALEEADRILSVFGLTT